MEAPRPMDRLICGDVGYGKTEVALRAAFKAVQDGKQVMLLVPTTILAQQHYGTFTERLKDYPITIEHVSRFRPAAEQREAVKRFSEGKVDILIGTHRLLSRDVRAKDLGLLIVDEEQRFGVKQKELLRQLKLKVDVIAMSATPIPRTLQMSMAGIRDISVIETPPEGRRPIKTYVGEYDEELVKGALIREHERKGQAFFLHNRIETIDETAERLRALCPKMKFEVAHGQMDERELEHRMLAFLRGDADVLVCTSIIESGHRHPAGQHADRRACRHVRPRAALPDPRPRGPQPGAGVRVPAVSERRRAHPGRGAETVGPQRLHRARRRVQDRHARPGDPRRRQPAGRRAVRSRGCARVRALHADARRGGGGGIRRFVGAEDDWEPVRLDVNVDAYVPADYIPYEQAKVDVHRRIAGAREVADLMELRDELEDRFGELPDPLKNLIALQQARIKLGQAGARAVTFRNGRLAVTPIELDSVRAKRIRQEIPEALYESGKSQLSMRVPEDPVKRFPAVVRAADVLLAVTREAA